MAPKLVTPERRPRTRPRDDPEVLLVRTPGSLRVFGYPVREGAVIY
ncbi:MAG TPA: hypothetical protein IAA98_04740 [Candidatus Avipropionibacterium avicola]|uniref:Uncharacterized protein n=1 Tax=Candidatus Avipropionibacterium avicola TaxID=2840701 RepID=A0A9D1GX64_9ACTN|nr:hypothetical protein [Candidatus Avipropionibacterium avicola]